VKIIRKAQLLTLLITAGIGILVLFHGHKLSALQALDKYLSPFESGTITQGSLVEDPHPHLPRQRILRKVYAPSNKAPDYLLCLIDDDPDQINAFGTYHPTDLAITLENLQEKGVTSIYITTHLRWPQLDPEERATLSTTIETFDHATLSTPLRRDPSTSRIPDFLLRSSLPAKALGKDADLIPQVNTLSLPPDIEVPNNALTGFSSIETITPTHGTIPLLARWDDRIVFNANLIEHLQHLNLTIEDLTVIPGQSIRLGNQGNIIPIDRFGQYRATPLTKTPTPPVINAAYSAEASMIGITQKAAILTAKGQKASAFATIEDPYTTLSEIANTPTVSAEILNNRFPLWLEIILIIDLALLAAFLLPFRSYRRHTVFIIALFAIPAIIILISQTTSYSSPAFIYILTILTGYLTITLLAKPVRKKYLDLQSETPDTLPPPNKGAEKEFNKKNLTKQKPTPEKSKKTTKIIPEKPSKTTKPKPEKPKEKPIQKTTTLPEIELPEQEPQKDIHPLLRDYDNPKKPLLPKTKPQKNRPARKDRR